MLLGFGFDDIITFFFASGDHQRDSIRFFTPSKNKDRAGAQMEVTLCFNETLAHGLKKLSVLYR